MTPQLPSFLRRRLLLSEARKALLAGRPEDALAGLDDPCLARSEEAEALRGRVLDVLCREAARLDGVGRPDESRRLLGRVSLFDPEQARGWLSRLGMRSDSSPQGPTSAVRREAESGIIGALEKLLGEMREERAASRRGNHADGGMTADSRDTRRAADSADRPAARGPERRFKLSIDDVGELFVLHGSRATLGHSRAGRADLPVLADVDPLHVRFVRTESFHAGPGWRVEPEGEQQISIDGQLVEPGGAALLDGDRVRLAGNLSFVFRRPEAASSSAILELLGESECGGCRRILLWAPGEEGFLRVGPGRGRYLRATRLEEDLRLWIDGRELVLECAGGLRAEGGEVDPSAPSSSGPGGLRTPLPPRARVAFVVGQGGAEGPPFGLQIAPLELGSVERRRR